MLFRSRHGRSVKLLVVPSINVFDAVAQTAVRLKATDIVVGESAKFSAGDQAHYLGEAWDRIPHESTLTMRLTVYMSDGGARTFSLGAHAPNLTPDDIEHIHRLWLEVVKKAGSDVHHRDIVTAALSSFEEELRGNARHALARLERQASAERARR